MHDPKKQCAKPTVIKLRDHLLVSSITLSTCTRNPQPAFAALKQEPFPCTNDTTEGMDVEIDTDFEWLLKFDLRSVCLSDIDDSKHEMESKKAQNAVKEDNKESLQKPNRNVRKYPIPKKSTRHTYTQMIVQCLNELGEASVKTIYQWIIEKFSSFKSVDSKWKNAIRHSLSICPLFHKKKLKSGKPYVWYLNEKFFSQDKKEMALRNHYYDQENGAVRRNCMTYSNANIQTGETKLILSNHHTLNSNVKNELIAKTKHKIFPIEDDKTSSEFWSSITSGSQEESYTKHNTTLQYYELQAPLTSDFMAESADYVEPLEVTFLLNEMTNLDIHVY